jgi:hypothetical protein
MCYHRTFPTPNNYAILNMIHVAEDMAEGLATNKERVEACNLLVPLLRLPVDDPLQRIAFIASDLGARHGWEATRVSAQAVHMKVMQAWDDNADGGIARDEEQTGQSNLLRDMFGPLPFRPVTVHPHVLGWNDRLVVRLAQNIYDQRRWGDMPILGDALLDAGCDNEEVVAHCRAGNEHVRGCYVLDILLGKE